MGRLTYIQESLGFDRSSQQRFEARIHVACSQCEAWVINGIPTHEQGCPNRVRPCRECHTGPRCDGCGYDHERAHTEEREEREAEAEARKEEEREERKA